jgi:hypothetical protein
VVVPGADVIDFRVLERLADAVGSRVPVRQALDRWLAELPGRLDAIRTAAGTRADVRLAAQRLESPSTVLGLVAVADACRALAEPAGTGATSELLGQLDEALTATWAALASWR